MKRSGRLKTRKPLRRFTRLRPMSAKRRRLERERREFVRRRLEANPRCEVRPILERALAELDPYRPDAAGAARALRLGLARCGLWAVEVHEPLKRARGGSIVDDDNALNACRLCNEWAEEFPTLADAIGVTVPSWEARS